MVRFTLAQLLAATMAASALACLLRRFPEAGPFLVTAGLWVMAMGACALARGHGGARWAGTVLLALCAGALAAFALSPTALAVCALPGVLAVYVALRAGGGRVGAEPLPRDYVDSGGSDDWS